MEAPHDYKRACLEGEGKTIELGRREIVPIGNFAEFVERNEKLGGDAIAPLLVSIITEDLGTRVGKAGTANPDVRHFVGEREKLRCLRVGAVDENKWREWIGNREAPELVRVKLALVVASDDAVV